MDYDSYIQELVSDSVPQDRAEHAIAEAVWAYMNELAENANELYEQALQQRCQDHGQRYVSNRPPPEEFPLELFTNNIKANKLDVSKWNETVQDYLLEHMPLGNPVPHADKETEIMCRLSAVDREIHATLPYEKDLPQDAAPFIKLLPVANFIGRAIATVARGVGMAVGIRPYREKQDEWQRYRGPGLEIRPVAPIGGRNKDPPPPPPPPPAPLIPGTTQGQARKRDNRNRKKKRQTGKDERRKAGKDYYFGYVDRVEPAGTGFEVRVEAIAQNSLSDEIFIREVQKLAVAAGNPSFGRYRLALISIFLHSVPSAVEVGKWINFKVNTEKKTLATKDSPDVSGAFTDGVTVLETLEPRLSFFNLRTECYFADNNGYVVQTDVKTIKRDITTGVFNILQAAFSTFDLVAATIRDLLDQFMNQGFTNETPGLGPAQEVMGIPRKKPTPTPRKIGTLTLSKASYKEIKAVLFHGEEWATKYNLYNVGQGHSGRVFNGRAEIFANDFGYGRVGDRQTIVCSHMIKGQGHLPILLSHWDADHFRIAKSVVAKHYSGKADDVTRRPWVAPGGDHISGPITHELAWNIQRNKMLLQWPKDKSSPLSVGNVTIISCVHNAQYKMPDKNNHGALALVVGGGDDFLIYPGDANFESIPGIKKWNRKVHTLIATHHGSTVALKSQGVFGDSIPESRPGEAYALFSYAKGNTYGHDVKKAAPYYEAAGYKLVDTTASFNPREDTFEIPLFNDRLTAADDLLVALPDITPAVPPSSVTGSIQSQDAASKQPTALGKEVQPGLLTTSMPEVPTNWAETARDQPSVIPSDGASTEFPDVLTLTGSGEGAPKPNQDDLLQYGIRDEEGDIVIYDITARKIVLEKLPLCVPCNTDYPVTVQISCQDIEIRDAQPQDHLVPLVRFEVANGFEWTQAADPGQDGQAGNPGYAGGRVRLAVAGNWTRTGTGSAVAMSGLKIQYRGGKGSSGQMGGAGVGGVSGGRGGDAGEPGSIANSEVLAVSSKWPAGWKVAIDTGASETDSGYGKPGKAGKGGICTPGDKNGRKGDDGKEYDISAAQFTKAKVNLRMIATEDEMLDQMAPVDWRYSWE